MIHANPQSRPGESRSQLLHLLIATHQRGPVRISNPTNRPLSALYRIPVTFVSGSRIFPLQCPAPTRNLKRKPESEGLAMRESLSVAGTPPGPRAIATRSFSCRELPAPDPTTERTGYTRQSVSTNHAESAGCQSRKRHPGNPHAMSRMPYSRGKGVFGSISRR